MAKNRVRTDALREVKNTRSRFLSLFLLSALAVAFLAGLRAAAPDMKHSADRFFDETAMMDVHILSTLGLTEDDISAAQNAPSVERAEGAYTVDAVLPRDSGDLVVKTLSYRENGLNQPVPVEGRMPEKPNECLLDAKLLTDGLSLGDTVSLQPGESMKDAFRYPEYTVVGVARSPLYISIVRGSTNLGSGWVNGFLLIPEEGYSLDYYTDLYAAVAGAQELSAYSDAYQALTDAAVEELEELGAERAALRHDEVVSDATEQLQDAETELQTAERDAAKQLSDAKRELQSARKKLDDGWLEYQAGQEKLSSETAAAQQKINDGEASLAAALAELEKAQAALPQGEAPNEQLMAQYEAGMKQYEAGKAELEQARLDLAAAIAKGEAELQAAYQELTDGERDYRNGLAEYKKAEREAEEKLADARRELDDAKQKIAKIEECKWYVLDRDANPGFVTFGQDSDRMTGLASVFPLIFFFVAALVCLTTMTRMVEEQRVQIGGLKALGYEKGAIAFKYAGYGFSAGLLGGSAGAIVGVTLIPFIIYNSWRALYTALPPISFLPQPLTAALSIAAATAVLTLSALSTCLNALTASPAQLMRPKAPPAGKRVLLERIPALWKNFSFHQKVTLRNLFRYKKRFIMTLAGIGGCTALIVTGFGLRDSIFEIMDLQYGELTHSSVILSTKADITPDQRQELLRVLDNSGAVSNYLLCSETAVTGETERYSLSLSVVSVKEPESLVHFSTLRERGSKTPVPFEEDSVLLTEKAARKFGVGAGDSLTLTMGDKRYTVTVTGVIENYIQHYIYTTDAMYEKIFGEAPESSLYWLSCPEADAQAMDALTTDLVALPGVTGLTRISTVKDAMLRSLESVNYAVVVIIVSAAALAFVVLYNLTNINITERMRELATLKVLGFYDRELSAYIYRENILLTAFGIVIGLFCGKALLSYLIGTVEMDMVMFSRSIKPLSYLLGAVLTAGFSLLVNLAAHRRLKRLDMVESLKTVE